MYICQGRETRVVTVHNVFISHEEMKTKPCNNHKSLVLPINIKLHIYTIKHRVTFTIDQIAQYNQKIPKHLLSVDTL